MTRIEEIQQFRVETGLSIQDALKHYFFIDLKKAIDNAEDIDDIKKILHTLANRMNR